MISDRDAERARLRRAPELIRSRGETLGDLAGVYGFEKIAERALAGEDVAPVTGPLGLDGVSADLSGRRRLGFLLVSFLVTRDGEQQHPMDVSVVKLTLTDDSVPDDASIRDLVTRISHAAQRKAAERSA
jgi:hypothetical protein